MSSDNAKAKLLTILQARDIPLGLDDVTWAFESAATKGDAVAWIEEYLTDANLLTKDELSLYEAIGDSAKLELSKDSHDVVPLQERDIREAIAALKSSTSAIESHARALETQKDILLELSGNGNANGAQGMSAKYGQEQSSLNFAIEDLRFSISEQLKEAEESSLKALTGIRSFSTERLAADEQVLEALSGLSSKAVQSDDLAVSHSDLEKWFHTLSILRAEEMKARIDTMLVSAGSISHAKIGDEGADLHIELQTLKDEIESVVQMVIGHELRNPLMKTFEAAEKGKRQNQQGWSQYLLQTLEYLITQLTTATTRISDLHAYINALLEIRALLTTTTTEPSIEHLPTPASSVPTAPNHRRKPTGSQLTTPTSLSQALRRLNIKPSDTGVPSTEILAQLDVMAKESTAKLHAQYAATEKGIIDTLGRSLAPRQKDALAVLEQLYRTSEFSSVSLSDRGLDAKVRMLGKRIDEVAPRVAGADSR